MEKFVETHGHLLTGDLYAEFVAEKASTHAEAVHQKSNAMPNCIGFLDGSVIGISGPRGSRMHNVVYIGHKRKHALKHQTIVSPDGLILHAFGLLEGLRHDWTLYVRCGMVEQLCAVLSIDGKQYFIYRDSGYNRRTFMEVPFQSSNLTAAQKAFNGAMSSVRVTAEWLFKEIKIFWSAMDSNANFECASLPLVFCTWPPCYLRIYAISATCKTMSKPWTNVRAPTTREEY